MCILTNNEDEIYEYWQAVSMARMMKSASDNAKKQCDPCYYTSRLCSVLCLVQLSCVVALVVEVQCCPNLYLLHSVV